MIKSSLMSNIHNSDPWIYRYKRSIMTEVEMLKYDLDKVVLLNALGNAGLNESYEYIVSHINSTNSQWIKRAGLHSLRCFHDMNVSSRLA